ncbi:MAG: hypothetical protein DI533_10880 [Cereibacter sphaeroides]|uniref:Uncharacterized protein n=1 Tax=Cereibacter sphaeroides TaxID=1063 RepID=A0A2W5S3M1_CERSP|nr:MAG: hypothetical protein DI533_10880 [Cereibacter sphaeroides]
MFLAKIPFSVSRTLGWVAQNVFITVRDAQKIRHHPMHGMDATKGLQLPMVIRKGDYYQSNRRGTVLQIEVVLHEMDNPKRAYFLVLSRNKEDTGIFIRTFYFSSELPRNKMKGASKILIQSTTNYFK